MEQIGPKHLVAIQKMRQKRTDRSSSFTDKVQMCEWLDRIEMHLNLVI